MFFAEIQLKKENLKSVFWSPEIGHPNSGIIVSQNNPNTSLDSDKAPIKQHSKGILFN